LRDDSVAKDMDGQVADVTWNAYRKQYALQIGEELLEVSKQCEVFPPLEGNNS